MKLHELTVTNQTLALLREAVTRYQTVLRTRTAAIDEQANWVGLSGRDFYGEPLANEIDLVDRIAGKLVQQRPGSARKLTIDIFDDELGVVRSALAVFKEQIVEQTKSLSARGKMPAEAFGPLRTRAAEIDTFSAEHLADFPYSAYYARILRREKTDSDATSE